MVWSLLVCQIIQLILFDIWIMWLRCSSFFPFSFKQWMPGLLCFCQCFSTSSTLSLTLPSLSATSMRTVIATSPRYYPGVFLWPLLTVVVSILCFNLSISPLLMSDKVFMTFRVNKSQCFLFYRDRPFHRDTFTKPWISSWLDLVGELEVYVNHFHPGGLKWNI